MRSVKDQIVFMLIGRGARWMAGGRIEREVSAVLSVKPSNVSRRCRELVEEQRLERGEFMIEGRKCVCYRLQTVDASTSQT